MDKGAPPEPELSDYRQAFELLAAQLGRYCSYCERWIASALAVEHKVPKSAHPDLARSWSNLLLACATCNSHKSDKQAEVVWPDEDDTLDLIEYRPSGRVRPRPERDPVLASRAEALLSISGLDRTPAEASPSDFRWQDRLETWRMAQQAREDLAGQDTTAVQQSILRLAVTRGGFSIWFAVFSDRPEIRAALVKVFPGTVLRHALEPRDA